MKSDSAESATRILESIITRDGKGAALLMPLVHQELHNLASNYFRHESSGHTLQPTALINEAYLRLIDQTRVDWQGRTHFFAVAAQTMRRVLVDHARGKAREKRGGSWQRVSFDEDTKLSPRRDEDVLVLGAALEELAELDPRQAQIVELRFFGGMTVAEVAEVLGVSERTIGNEWRVARAWLRQKLSEDYAS